MKLHLFYLIGSSFDELADEKGVNADSIEKIDDDRYYTLYAFTHKKYNAKKFMSDRNMDKFLYKTTEIDKLQFEIFCEANVDHFLDIRDVKCQKCIKNTIGRTDVGILCTNIEYDQLYIYGYENFYEILDDITTDILTEEVLENLIFHVLKDKYLHPLTRVLLMDEIIPFHPYEEDKEIFTVNEFELFIRLFSNTLNMKEG